MRSSDRVGAARRDRPSPPGFACLLVLLYPVVTMADPHVHAGSRRELLGEDPTPEAIARYSLERADWTATAPMFLRGPPSP